jgi:hypothetical protein
MVFAVLTIPQPRVFRLVCRTDNSFGAEIAFAFAPTPGVKKRERREGRSARR